MSELSQEEMLKLNKLARRWSRVTRKDMEGAAPGKLGQKLKGSNRYRSGLIEAVGFQFPRYGVFVEMGVFGGLTRDEARAQGKLNPKPWFNPALDEHYPKLVDDIQKLNKNFIVKEISKLKIKNT